MIKREDFEKAFVMLGLSDTDVLIHSSIRSFGDEIDGGVAIIADVLLGLRCTILVPAFSDAYEEKPVPQYMPERNGAGDYSYFLDRDDYDANMVYTPESKVITTEEMGIFPAMILNRPGCIRGNHPLNSFAALGRRAVDLIGNQSPEYVYAPLGQLYNNNGYVLLMGTDLTSATIIHYAEQQSGRRPFVRWANDRNKHVIPVSVGGCSDGFNNFNNPLSPIGKTVVVGKSVWKCYNAREMVDICVQSIFKNPEITRCENPYCDRCKDAILGGPLIDFEFSNNS